MSCFLCGSDEGHYLGCYAAQKPGLTEDEAIELHLLPAKPQKAKPKKEVVEILQENSMTTVPVEDDEEEIEEIEEIPLDDKTSDMCEFATCNNPKWSTDPRAKWCEDHRDPKSRKE